MTLCPNLRLDRFHRLGHFWKTIHWATTNHVATARRNRHLSQPVTQFRESFAWSFKVKLTLADFLLILSKSSLPFVTDASLIKSFIVTPRDFFFLSFRQFACYSVPNTCWFNVMFMQVPTLRLSIGYRYYLFINSFCLLYLIVTLSL